MSSEIWMPVDGFPYEVSNEGRVRNSKGSVLRQYRQKNGYMAVKLFKDGKGVSFRVHRLVAVAFLNKPEGKNEVNHKDGDKENNAASNLEWSNRSENVRHAFMTGINRTTRERIAAMAEKAAKANRKRVVRSDGAEFPSVREAAEASGAKPQNVSKCIHGSANTAAGYSFALAPEKGGE